MLRTKAAQTSPGLGVGGEGRPVVLATLGVPFDEEAASYAVDAAVESGQRLIVVNVTQLEPLPMSLRLGYDALEEFTPDVTASAKRPAQLAASLGIEVERVRVRSPRPVRALLELVLERRAGLLVFGPDRSLIAPRTYRRAVRAIREDAGCLVWVAAGEVE
jgi:nucleotide-binding universal stress UspA family protein